MTENGVVVPNIIFGTSNPNIDSETLVERVTNNFKINKDSLQQTSEEIIDGIKSIIHMLGAFSLRIIGLDEYDRKKYVDYDSDNDSNDHVAEENKIRGSLIEGANSEVSPIHSIVSHVDKNKWRHVCLNMYYIVNRGIIPNPTHPEYTAIHGNSQSSFHNFPRFFKIKRTNGDIQDGCWLYNESIKLHKSKTLNDTHERLYITVNYLPDKTEDIHSRSDLEMLHKHMPLDNVIEINPDIKDIDFRFFVWSDTTIAESDSVKSEIMVHFNSLHHEWRETRLIPAITRLNLPIKINLIYENNPNYNISLSI